MKIRTLRRLLESVDEMANAVVGIVASDGVGYKSVIMEMANDPKRLHQFRQALIEATKCAAELDATHI